MSGTNVVIYNWTGAPVYTYVMRDTNNYWPLTIPPTAKDPVSYQMTLSASSYMFNLRNGTETYRFQIPTVSGTATVYLVANTGTGWATYSNWTTNDSNSGMTVSSGYHADTAVIVQGDYYSPASSYTFPTGSVVISAAQLPTDLTSVTDSFNPPSSCESGDDDSTTEKKSNSDSSAWWAIGIGLALIVLLILVLGGVVLWKRKSGKTEASEGGENGSASFYD